MGLFGNLGTPRMIFQGWERLGSPDSNIENANVLQRWSWAGKGVIKNLAGEHLPYGDGDWYWNPSRAIPSPGDIEPITEFPFFTVLYGDPHAHLFALPISLLALAFALALVQGRMQWNGPGGAAAAFLIGGLAIGALRPTNTWDFYTYLAIGVVAAVYALSGDFEPSTRLKETFPLLKTLPAAAARVIFACLAAIVLVLLAYFLYQPFAAWYATAYSQVNFWQGLLTPLDAYITHWGVFLFLIVSWLLWETIDWMASTPVSSLRKLEPYRYLLMAAGLLLALMILVLGTKLPEPVVFPIEFPMLGKLNLFRGVSAAWLVIPLSAWALALILRPDQPDTKRFALFLIGTGLTLTMMVEMVVLVGDISRMNTVFKFYLQVWTLFAVVGGAAFGWLLESLPEWRPGPRLAWQIAAIGLALGAAMYPLWAGSAKVKDRMVLDAPHTLDGMEFMRTATYNEDWGPMDLNQDYQAIRWMQENVKGSPVIVEANLRNLYRWGSRFSIYTGLPGVIGWEWHQQQQRSILPGERITRRIAEVDNFYLTTDLQEAHDFLKKYNVRYIIMGQQERGHYPGSGLEKFDGASGVLWKEVYRDRDTVIYEVIST
jgi:YYY domain-containing protein